MKYLIGMVSVIMGLAVASLVNLLFGILMIVIGIIVLLQKEEEKHPPKYWEIETGVRLDNYNGWTQPHGGMNVKGINEPITKEEFIQRAIYSKDEK